MKDLIVGIGLVFVIEGIAFAAFPQAAKRAVVAITETPEQVLRVIGLGSAIGGLVVIWLMRG
jgi:uncharacterized protein YjeT (DUF2065 family)